MATVLINNNREYKMKTPLIANDKQLYCAMTVTGRILLALTMTLLIVIGE